MKKTIIVLAVWIFILFWGHEREERASYQEKILLSLEEDAENFQTLPPLLKKDEAFLKKAVKKNGLLLQYLDAKYRANKTWALLAVKEDGMALEHVSNMLKSDEEVVFEALKERGRAFKFANRYLKENRAFVLKLLKERVLYFFDEIDETLQEDKTLIEMALIYDEEAFKYLDESLQNNREYFLPFLKKNGWILRHLDEAFQKDRELVTLAVMQDSYTLTFVDETLSRDKAFLSMLIEKNDKILGDIDPEVWKDNAFLLKYLKEKGFGLEYASKEQQSDRALVLKAVEYDGFSLEYASEMLKKDKALVLKSLDAYSDPLKFADKRLTADREFMKTAIAVNEFSIVSIDNKLKKDRELVLQAILQNQEVLEYLPKFKKDKAFIVDLIERDINVFPYIDASLKNDKEILEALKTFPSAYDALEKGLMLLGIVFSLLFVYFWLAKNKKYFLFLVASILLLLLVEILKTYFTHGVFRMPYVMVDETHKFGLERTKCWVGHEKNLSMLACYNMHVPEIHNDPKSNVITFPVRVFRSSDMFAKNPLLHLGGGGPGGEMQLSEDYALESHLDEHDAFSLNQGRDLFIIDPRGAGLSKPLLNCGTYVDNFVSNMKKVQTRKEEYAAVEHDYAECIDKFKKEKVNFNGYNSFAVAKDIELLKQMVDVDKWVLFGVSYSTTYAMIIAKKYPEMVESMILDSACFPNLKLDHNYLLQQTDCYTALYDYAEKIKDKNETNITKSIDVESRMWALHKSLNMQPLQTDYLDLKVNGDYFVGSLLWGVYGTEVFKDLPKIVQEMEEGKLESFLPYFKNYLGYLMDRSYGDVSSMAHYCFEDKPFIDFEKIKKKNLELPKGYIQESAIAGFEANDFCKEMNISSTDKSLAESIQTEIPTLFIHGEFDSITPLRDVLREMKSFKNSKLLTYKTSHSVLGTEEKIEEDVAVFMEKYLTLEKEKNGTFTEDNKPSRN